MSEKRELIRRTMQIVREIFQKGMQPIPYCKGDMEWRFNHMSGYGLYCTHIRKALQGCMDENRKIGHQEYHVQSIAQQVDMVSGLFCLVPKQDEDTLQGTPYEIVICMLGGVAQCIHIYGARSARILCKVRSFHEETYFLEEAEVLYIESSHNNVIWHCREYQVESRDSLKRLEQCLPDIFTRIHRGYIINAAQIHRIGSNEVQMANGDVLSIPVRNSSKVRRSLLSQISQLRNSSCE